MYAFGTCLFCRHRRQAIIWILFLLDGTFAIAQYLQQKEIGRFRDYIVGEQTFQVLSLTSKLLLAWIN